MPLTPDQRQQLQDALTAAFNEDELRQMLSLRMGVDLDKIVAHGPLTTRVFDLIKWAERRGREAELIAAAQNYQSDLNEKAKGAAAPVAAAPVAGAAEPQAANVKPTDAAPQSNAPQPPKKRAVPRWVTWVAVVIVVPLLVGIVGNMASGIGQLFIEYGYFIPASEARATPSPQSKQTTPAASPSPAPQAPPASPAGVPTLEIAYGDTKQASVDGIDVLVSVPTNGDAGFWIDQLGTVSAVVVADGAQASGRLKIGECLLAGGVTVTLLDLQNGTGGFNRFAVARAGEGAAGCVNSTN